VGVGYVLVGDGRGGGALVCYLYCVVIKSNMELYVSVYVSFNCKLLSNLHLCWFSQLTSYIRTSTPSILIIAKNS
jgi:hypothetical protein